MADAKYGRAGVGACCQNVLGRLQWLIGIRSCLWWQGESKRKRLSALRMWSSFWQGRVPMTASCLAGEPTASEFLLKHLVATKRWLQLPASAVACDILYNSRFDGVQCL